MTKLSSQGMAQGAYGQTSASLGGSLSHNAPINVGSLAAVTHCNLFKLSLIPATLLCHERRAAWANLSLKAPFGAVV